MESYWDHGCQANDLHLVLVPPLPEHGVDSGAVPQRPDVEGDNRECKILVRVLCGPVYRWSRLQDQTLLLSRMTVRWPLDHLLLPSLMRDWLWECGLRP